MELKKYQEKSEHSKTPFLDANLLLSYLREFKVIFTNMIQNFITQSQHPQPQSHQLILLISQRWIHTYNNVKKTWRLYVKKCRPLLIQKIKLYYKNNSMISKMKLLILGRLDLLIHLKHQGQKEINIKLRGIWGMN